jgi:4-hydroxybenzoate polyprenyltransferase
VSLTRIVRARDWWDHKIPPLLGVAYVLMHVGDVPFRTGALAIAAFFLFLIATASFGYFLNDLCDIEADRVARKRNVAGELAIPVRAAVLTGLLALIGAPWLWLPSTGPISLLVGLELALFVVYAVPPVRLKARGAPALVADALYAHTVPMLLTVLTFAALAGHVGHARELWLVAGWSFLTGFRGILLHQVDDLRADQEAGIKTAITPRNRLRAVSWVLRVVLPIEAVLLGVLVCRVSTAMPLFVAYVAVAFAILTVAMLREAKRRARDESARYCSRAYRLRSWADLLDSWTFNHFYERWMPLFPLVALSVADPMYLLVATGHLLLFRSALPLVDAQQAPPPSVLPLQPGFGTSLAEEGRARHITLTRVDMASVVLARGCEDLRDEHAFPLVRVDGQTHAVQVHPVLGREISGTLSMGAAQGLRMVRATAFLANAKAPPVEFRLAVADTQSQELLAELPWTRVEDHGQRASLCLTVPLLGSGDHDLVLSTRIPGDRMSYAHARFCDIQLVFGGSDSAGPADGSASREP